VIARFTLEAAHGERVRRVVGCGPHQAKEDDMRRLTISLTMTIILAGLAGPSEAAPTDSDPAAADPGAGAFEVYGGTYNPENEFLDNDLTFGVRGTYRWRDAAAFELSVGRYEDDKDFAGVASLDFSATLVDASVAWTFNPGSRAELAVFGGPGWAFVDAKARALGVWSLAASNDTFTLHLGADVRISLSDRVYLRPDVRARYFEESEDVDLEASIAVGFRIGG
jgi:hypothetical protein